MSKTIVRLTGLTDDLLKGRRIDADAVAAQLADVNLCIAHDANFDRRVLERAFPTLPICNWACSMVEIDWAAQGAAGRRLGDLLAVFGLFNAAHRADADARALLHLLSLPLPATGELVLAALLAAARRASAVIVAAGAPYDASPKLKARGYLWSRNNRKLGGAPSELTSSPPKALSYTRKSTTPAMASRWPSSSARAGDSGRCAVSSPSWRRRQSSPNEKTPATRERCPRIVESILVLDGKGIP